MELKINLPESWAQVLDISEIQHEATRFVKEAIVAEIRDYIRNDNKIAEYVKTVILPKIIVDANDQYTLALKEKISNYVENISEFTIEHSGVKDIVKSIIEANTNTYRGVIESKITDYVNNIPKDDYDWEVKRQITEQVSKGLIENHADKVKEIVSNHVDDFLCKIQEH